MKSRAEIEAAVARVIAGHLSCDQETVKPTASLENDLGADSLDIVEITMACEEEFGVVIPDDRGAAVVTVEDVIKLVEEFDGK